MFSLFLSVSGGSLHPLQCGSHPPIDPDCHCMDKLQEAKAGKQPSGEQEPTSIKISLDCEHCFLLFY